MIKQFYFKQISLAWLNKVKWFQVLQRITNNSIKDLIHFKNGTDYLTKEAAQVFIPLMRFLLYTLISRSFLVLQRYVFFLSFPLVWWCPLPIFPSICKFPFHQLLLLLLLFYSLRVFHINISWWSFTRVWETASFPKSPGPFSVFWTISTML